MSFRRVTRFAAPAAILLAATAIAGCSSSKSPASSTTGTGAATSSAPNNPLAGSAASGSVVVGSDNFAESILLADIYGQALKAKGINVSYKLNIGSREVTYNLMKNGTITLKPEYNGALLAYLDKNAPQTSTSQVDAAITAALPSNLQILTPSTAQDNDTLTISKQEASSLGLSQGATISQFISKLGGKPITMGGSSEFQTRQQGLAGLEQVYGLKSSQVTYKTLDAGGPLTEKALTSNTVQASDLFTTDPTIAQGGLLTLVDDKGIFGVQDVLPLASKNLSAAGVAALNAVDAKLDSSTLLQLDSAVQVQKVDPLTVANGFLQTIGLS